MGDAEGFLSAAADLLGERGLTRDPELVAPWLTDWRGRFTGRALALASPATAAQVSALMKLCSRYGVPVVPQGGNSGMSGGATPDASGDAIVLSLRRLNAIRRLDPQAREVVCEAGVILQTLHQAALERGFEHVAGQARQRRRALAVGRQLDERVPGVVALQRGAATGHMGQHGRQAVAGHHLEALERAPGAAFGMQQQGARILDRGEPGPQHRPVSQRREETQGRRGDDAQRALRSDQQLLQVEAAVVFLERGERIEHRSVG